MPAHAVVAEPREEVQNGVVGPQLAALREAADGKYVSVEAPCVALVAPVLADAGDEALGRKPQKNKSLSPWRRTDDTGRSKQTRLDD